MTTVAEVLKREREAQGITLEEVAQKTYIKLHYLHALEEDRPDLLPAPVYTCGYIRQYAKLLGLNGAELVNIYQQQNKPREYSIVRNVAPALGEPESKPVVAHPEAINGQPTDLPPAAASVAEAIMTPPAPPVSTVPVAPPAPVVRQPLPLAQPAAAAPQPAAPAVPAPRTASSPQRATPARSAAASPADTTNLEVRIDTRDALLAHPEAEKILSLARQQADEIVAKARDEAQRLRLGAEQYADQVLSQLEGEIGRSLAIIKNGRMHLQTRQRSRRAPERLPERIAEPPVS